MPFDIMYYSVLENKTFLVRLEKGEKVISSIKGFCKKLDIKNALFMGLGSIEDPTLAHYNVNSKKYKEKALPGIFEATSLVGNAALFESEPLIHGHINLSDDEMRSFGGHLVEATVSATMELMVQDLRSSKMKKYDERIGLKLFELDEHL